MKLDNNALDRDCPGCDAAYRRFCQDLHPDSRRRLDSIRINNLYPRGSVLFAEGQPSQGVYLLCSGKVKLSTCSRDGKVIILQIAEPGEILGLSAVVADLNFETTAEVIEPSRVSFVRKSEFLEFLRQDSDACLSAVRQLSHNYQTAHLQICSLGLSHSVADKLARLFMSWCRSHGDLNADAVRLKNTYTHEEIAEMIGTSRETVSRLLKNFRERKLITLKGSDLIIHDRKRLELMAGN